MLVVLVVLVKGTLWVFFWFVLHVLQLHVYQIYAMELVLR